MGVQAKDVPEQAILEAVANPRLSIGISRWDIADVVTGFPERVLLAKLRAMVKRKLINGCACGCRGDFSIAPLGRAVLEQRAAS